MARIENVNIDGTDYDVGKIASTSNLGVVQVGSGLSITQAGVLSVDSGGSTLTITITQDPQDPYINNWSGATVTEIETAYNDGSTIFVDDGASGGYYRVTNATFSGGDGTGREAMLIVNSGEMVYVFYLYPSGGCDISEINLSQRASTSTYGVTQLSTSTSSTSTTVAATPSAVKAAYDLANSKLSITLSTTDIGQGASLAANTLYGVYE